ncbi:hypothetical protein PWT90_10854 [Aphanocladium album]|nr:hypothetical protein PWT90_10854 [Aphanocladium album]
MKAQLLLSAAWLAHLAAADIEPWLPYDVRTIQGCSFWYDSQGDRTCESVRDSWSVSPEDFARWNPSLSVDCKGWAVHQSYCVGVEAELASQRSSMATETLTTTDEALPTPTPAHSTSHSHEHVTTEAPTSTTWTVLGPSATHTTAPSSSGAETASLNMWMSITCVAALLAVW